MTILPPSLLATGLLVAATTYATSPSVSTTTETAAGSTLPLNVPMYFADSTGNSTAAGNIYVTQNRYGVVFSPALHGLPPGIHGFHMHENASCAPARKDGQMVPALTAGGHYDPDNTGKHGYPWGTGHLGDLPPVYASTNGTAHQPVLGPRLKMEDLPGHSLVIHAGGDNHSDIPLPLGGGGSRIICGVISRIAGS